MSYSQKATEFRDTLAVGQRFTPIEDHSMYAGKILTIDGLLRHYKNPDDCMYEIKDEDGNLLEPVRSWWLRKCCRKVS